MSKLPDFLGRWALVTGAGDGIGRSLALGLARQGLNVVVADILGDTAASVADEARSLGVDARPLTVDVSDRTALIEAGNALAADGVIPALVWANAGVGAGASLLEGSARAIEWAISVNVLSVVWTAQAFAPRLIDLPGPRHFGVTASTASITDVRGPFSLYAASKQGTAGIAEGLLAEFAPKGVGVTILYPGMVNTQIWNAARARPGKFGGPAYRPHDAGEPWRRTPGPDVLIPPVLEVIARGGGRCIVDVSGDVAEAFEARASAIQSAFMPWRQPD
jgi:NAD(P)-dependent dehydrogenase (short-subunit alcohol dehydrogenase family)